MRELIIEGSRRRRGCGAGVVRTHELALIRFTGMGAGPDPDALVFAGEDGAVLRANAWRSRFFNPSVKTAGLTPLRPNDLRHTAVALWIAAGANPRQIATWAGHTSVSVVLDRYGHLFEGH